MTRKRTVFLIIKSILLLAIVLGYEYEFIAVHRAVDVIGIILLVFITYDLVVWARAVKLAREEKEKKR